MEIALEPLLLHARKLLLSELSRNTRTSSLTVSFLLWILKFSFIFRKATQIGYCRRRTWKRKHTKPSRVLPTLWASNKTVISINKRRRRLQVILSLMLYFICHFQKAWWRSCRSKQASKGLLGQNCRWRWGGEPFRRSTSWSWPWRTRTEAGEDSRRTRRRLGCLHEHWKEHGTINVPPQSLSKARHLVSFDTPFIFSVAIVPSFQGVTFWHKLWLATVLVELRQLALK